MGTVMDIYQLVRDLIDEAKNQKNLELVDRLIEIKLALSEIEDENRDLKKRIEELEQSNIIDCGVPVLSMHAPYEVTSKYDIYSAYKTYKAFWEE